MMMNPLWYKNESKIKYVFCSSWWNSKNLWCVSHDWGQNRIYRGKRNFQCYTHQTLLRTMFRADWLYLLKVFYDISCNYEGHAWLKTLVVKQEVHLTTPSGNFPSAIWDPINSLWPSDTIWRQRSWPTLAQVMACSWRHKAITWINVDLSSVRSSGIHLRAISQEISQLPITEISLKIIYVKFHSNQRGANELMDNGPSEDICLEV